MSDPTSGLPAAGWYGDPSDPSGERWWGGLEWTDHTRPLDVAPPATATPQFPPPTGPAPTLQPPPPASALGSGAFGSQPAITASPAVPQFASQASSDIPQFASQTPAEVPQFASQTPSEVPQFASQTTNAIPQFASQQPELAAAPTAPFSPTQYTTAEEAAAAFGAAAAASSPPTGSWSAITTSPTASPWETPTADPYSFGQAPQQFGTTAHPHDAQPAAAWGASGPSQSYQSEPQTNPIAVVGFVLSLLGFNVISLVLSILGVRKATRLEQDGGSPVGRVLGRWGIGLSIVEIVALIGTAVLFGAAAAVYFQNPTAANVEVYEEMISAQLEDALGEKPRVVECPSDATFEPNTTHDCTIVLADGTGMVVRITFDNEGTATTEQVV